jgi:hypothetical protein
MCGADASLRAQASYDAEVWKIIEVDQIRAACALLKQLGYLECYAK